MNNPVDLLYPCDMSQAMITATWQDHKDRSNYTGNPGLDIGSYGQRKIPVLSVLAGTVTKAQPGWNDGYGNYVEIAHNGMKTRYCHLDSNLVKDGDAVKAGQVIGMMGTTGNSDGVHLHFELWIDGVNVDPQRYLGHLITGADVEPAVPLEFKLPQLQAVTYPKARVTGAVLKNLNVRLQPGGIDLGDLYAGDEVEVLDVLKAQTGDVWFAIRFNDQRTGMPVYGYSAAFYQNETYLEVLNVS